MKKVGGSMKTSGKKLLEFLQKSWEKVGHPPGIFCGEMNCTTNLWCLSILCSKNYSNLSLMKEHEGIELNVPIFL